MNMTIEQIARVAHEANRGYCESIGDYTQKSYDIAPQWQKESARSGVEGIVNGTIQTPEQSHESWLAQKAKEGWAYGPVKDETKRLHPCIVAYDQLPPGQRKKDALFFAVVHALKD